MINSEPRMALSTAFYDLIAKEYNGHMTQLDDEIRKDVLQAFQDRISCGNILDFGGGTGLDLPLLLHNQYKVYFLEPSPNMRSLARNSVSENSSNLIFA